MALRCPQSMPMCLDRDQRLTYLLDVIFALDSEAAARVLAISPAAYRKRFSRTRQCLAAAQCD